ncbi:E3 ubiquitin-protein ligase msl-2-like [Pollicipes pollicipes]|uniref:E3 ubiquitin-protein ligase msl-2-like n=1 Tax=Pollicipes pollicipes TaxID=41117 RepID=UPI001884E97A|nr:E3 ubiquitin-protein ligase msl-2-like [Pollicipes pollicipes]
MMSSSHALSLHLKLCKLVVEASVEESTSWGDLYKLLPQLRQALACTVCGCIIENPISPSDSQCQHSVCFSCNGGKKRLKPSCSYCKDYSAYISNQQLQLIVEAFRKTCQYLQQTEIYQKLNSFSLNGSKSSLVELIQEGANCQGPSEWTVKEDEDSFEDVPVVKSEMVDSEHSSNEGVMYHANIHISSPVNPPVITSQQIIPVSTSGVYSQPSHPSPEVHFSQQPAMSHMSSPLSQPPPPSSSAPAHHPLYSMFFSSDGDKAAKMKVTPVEAANYHKYPAVTSFGQVGPEYTNSRVMQNGSITASRSGGRKKLQKGCRCGNATPTPGKLTCCGQRCPCYVESRACMDCKCRGCRNPHRPGGKKVRPHIPNQENIKIHELQPVLQPPAAPEAAQNLQQQPVYQPMRIDSPHQAATLPPVHHVIHMQHPVFQGPMFINTVPVATIGSNVFMTDSSQNSDSIEV